MRSLATVILLFVTLVACQRSEGTVPSQPNPSQPNPPGRPLPSATPAPLDVWRGLRWDMPMASASQALSEQGLKVSERQPRKDPTTWLSTEVEGWKATVYFDEKGRMNQITLLAETFSREAEDVAKDRLTKRFGSIKATQSRMEERWTGSAQAGPVSVLVNRGPKGWFVREEHGRPQTTGPVGVFDLTWGMTAPEVEQKLRAAGYSDVATKPPDTDPCKMPNPPPNCEAGASVQVRFKRESDEGYAAVHKKLGLSLLWFTSGVASYAEGTSRGKSIGVRRGHAADAVEFASILKWSDATADVSLEVRENNPGHKLSAIENYRPPGTEE